MLGALPILLIPAPALLAVYAAKPHPWPGMTLQTSVRLDAADANSLNTKIKRLEGRQQKLQDKLDQASDPEPLIHPNLTEIYRAKVENLSSLFNSNFPKPIVI